MRASEKLRALEEQSHLVLKNGAGTVIKDFRVSTALEVLAALPLIADYIEATERYFAAHDRGEQGHLADVRAKRDALEEALS